MDKKYEIVWRNPQKTVLMVNYFGDEAWGWDEIVKAHIEAVDMIKELSYDVILFHKGTRLKTARIGVIHDILYSGVTSRLPDNLKHIIVFLENLDEMKLADAAFEIMDKLFIRRKFVHVV